MPTIRCKEKMRNERRMRGRLKKRTGLLEKPMTKILDVPGEMIRETKKGNVTEIKYCDKAHGGSPVTFVINGKKQEKLRKQKTDNESDGFPNEHNWFVNHAANKFD